VVPFIQAFNCAQRLLNRVKARRGRKTRRTPWRPQSSCRMRGVWILWLSVVHRNPTAWHCACHQQRGQAGGNFNDSTVLLCCTSTVLHSPAIIIGVAQPQEPATPTSFPLEEPFSHNRQDESLDHESPSTAADGRTLSSISKTIGRERDKETSCHFSPTARVAAFLLLPRLATPWPVFSPAAFSSSIVQDRYLCHGGSLLHA